MIPIFTSQLYTILVTTEEKSREYAIKAKEIEKSGQFKNKPTPIITRIILMKKT